METPIRPLVATDLPTASRLVLRVFDQFEAPDYPAEGIATFHRICSPEALAARFESGAMQIWGSFRDGELVGVLAVRDSSHISLLFVEPTCHRQGLARALFDHFRNTCRTGHTIRRITVNSSPFAVEVYARLGFAATSAECTENGIRFTPMEYRL